MDTKEFGSFISSQRKAQGLTQKELADKLMVTDKAISRWENGHGYPDIETLEDGDPIKAVPVSLEEVNKTLADTIKYNIDDRKKERKITALVFASSMVLLLVLSVFKNIAPVAIFFEVVGAVYLVASIVMIVDSRRNRSIKHMFIGILLLMVFLFFVFLLLSASIQINGIN